MKKLPSTITIINDYILWCLDWNLLDNHLQIYWNLNSTDRQTVQFIKPIKNIYTFAENVCIFILVLCKRLNIFWEKPYQLTSVFEFMCRILSDFCPFWMWSPICSFLRCVFNFDYKSISSLNNYNWSPTNPGFTQGLQDNHHRLQDFKFWFLKNVLVFFSRKGEWLYVDDFWNIHMQGWP